jgi:hypothetical protein
VQKPICAAAILPFRETNYNASAMCLRKLIVLGESNNFFDEVRRIKSKMYLPETMGAGAARFEFDTDDTWIFSWSQRGARLSHGE